jgi:hypothetical protein
MTTLAELMDLSAAEHASEARRGDLDAAHTMHAILADYIEHSNIPPLMRDLLVKMHRQIADGIEPAAVMLTAAPANRRITRTRQGRIAGEVQARVVLWRIADKFRNELMARGHDVPAKLNMSKIYLEVAKDFGITPDRVKKIWHTQK